MLNRVLVVQKELLYLMANKALSVWIDVSLSAVHDVRVSVRVV